jgi:hypothetical protein
MAEYVFFAERQSSAAAMAGATRASARGVTDMAVGSGAWFGRFILAWS